MKITAQFTDVLRPTLTLVSFEFAVLPKIVVRDALRAKLGLA
jgi:hypothetical protein